VTLFGTNSNASTYESFETMVVLQSVIQVKTVSLLETISSALLMTPFFFLTTVDDSFLTTMVLQSALQVLTVSLLDSF
jgi:hypothetical protein